MTTEAQALAAKIKDISGYKYDWAAFDDDVDRLAAMAQLTEQTRSQELTAAGFTRRPSLWAMQAREVLELIATPMRPDGTWNRDREACRQIAAEALGRYGDEDVQP